MARIDEPNSIQPRCSARFKGSAECSGYGWVSSRYSRMTADLKIAASPTFSTGVLAERRDREEPVGLVGEIDVDPLEGDALLGQR